MALAQAEELRAAVERFRAAGKTTRVYATSWDGGIAPYRLASAFEEIWVQPMGVVSIGGLRAEIPFAREALDAIGVRAQMYQRKEYKSAYESLTRKSMSDKSREELTSILEDIGARVGPEVERARGMESGAFKALVNQALFTAPEALEAGLVTHADYADRMVDAVEAEVVCAEEGIAPQDCPAPEGPGSLEPPEGFVWLESYLADVLPEDEGPSFLPERKLEAMADEDAGEPRVALIYVTGVIVSGDEEGGGPDAVMGEPVAAAREIAGAILDATTDGRYGAIVLRVDSPGGSPAASETIARAVEMAQERADLPVVVSMGPVAASGGYWVSAPADHIFADATTLTGSIGVVGGKISLGGLWEHILIRWDGVQWGENAGMWSGNAAFTRAQEARVGAMLDAVYDAFIARVAKGRNIEPDQVEAMAKGRVWTGAQAAERGLVDEIGGLAEALDYAAVKAGAEEGRAGARVDVFPRPLSGLEQIMKLLEGGATALEAQGVLARALSLRGWHLQGTLAYEPARVR